MRTSNSILKLGLICLLSFLSLQLLSQKSEKQNAVSIELGKNGLIFNAVFDHQFNSHQLGYKVNLGSNLDSYRQALKIGAGAYKLYGPNQHQFEVGMDAEYLSVKIISHDQVALGFLVHPQGNIEGMMLSLNTGYRKSKTKSLFRLGLSPVLLKSNLFIGGYLSYGFRL